MSSLHFTWLKKGESGTRPLLSVRNLCVRVGIRQILKNVNLEVFPGDHIRITGPNGSGKSTLLNAIAGVEPAKVTSGSIAMDGREIMLLPAHERASLGLAYMRQTDNTFPSLSVAENLRIALGGDGSERFRATFPEWAKQIPLDKPAGNLSGGQKKKLAWAMTSLQNSQVVMLDEPMAGVSDNSFEVINLLNKSCVIEVEHAIG
jgi:ABC-type branched-subunit amino acid transport system ATPase component